MSADTLVLAYRRPLCWHVDGDNFLHVDGNYLFCMSTETIFFCMSTGTIFFACRRRQSCLACRREQSFWHVDGDNLLWHVDGNIFACRRRQSFLHVDGDNNFFCMSTETILFWHVDGDNPFGMSTVWHVDASYPGSPIFFLFRDFSHQSVACSSLRGGHA